MTVPPVVGIIGAGNVLPAYLQVLDRLVPRGLAREGPICARRKETWPELLRRRPGAQLAADAREVVEADIDVVVVLTPPASHAELARLALEHGKHVVVEKPFAESREEGEALARLAAERGLHLLAAPFVQLSPDAPRVLDDRGRRCAGTRPLRAGALRQRRLALDDVVPLGRTRPAR